MRNKTEKRRKRIPYKYIGILVGILLALGIVLFLTVLFGGRFVVNQEDLVLKATTKIESADGEVIGRLYEENRTPVSIETIPDHVEQAFIAIEDKRFYEHTGIDIRSILRAVYRDIIAMSTVEGGSTITQQLAKNLFLTNDKTWMRKTKEVMAALYLERNYSKDEIMEYYLNEVYFAHGVYGIEEAAQYYYSKPASELEPQEGAMFAAMVKAPNSYSPVDHPEAARERRNLVLQEMEEMEMFSTEERLTLQGKTLGLNREQTEDKPWLASYIDLAVKEVTEEYDVSLEELRRGGYRIITHLNDEAQQVAYEEFQNDDYFPGSIEGVEGAFVLTEVDSGNIIAALGGRAFLSGDLNRLEVNRQPGSTIKPLVVYGPAMMEGGYQPYTLLQDEKTDFNGYVASNYDDSYLGEVSMYQALIESRNAPAVWLLNEIGISTGKKYLEEMNMKLDDKGLAVALGGFEEGITPVQLTDGYRTIASGGIYSASTTIEAVFTPSGESLADAPQKMIEVFNSQISWYLTRMLEGVVQEGTGTSGSYNLALAGKTGSTQHTSVEDGTKDAWFAGFTPEYATTLWMGYDQSDETRYLTEGSSAPTRLTKRILSRLESELKLSAAFEKPGSVEELPEPVELPVITNLEGEFGFGGFSLVKAELTWKASSDDRIVYYIYREGEEEDEKIGEVTGAGRYEINRINLFRPETYYVVPYDPLTGKTGEASNRTTISYRN